MDPEAGVGSSELAGATGWVCSRGPVGPAGLRSNEVGRRGVETRLMAGGESFKSVLASDFVARLVYPLLYGKPVVWAGQPVFASIMAVKIRLKRAGAKNNPVYRIVVADGRSPRDGKFIEELGTYQPLQKGTNYTVNLERAKYWIGVGAQASDTVAGFIKHASRTAAAAAV